MPARAAWTAGLTVCAMLVAEAAWAEAICPAGGTVDATATLTMAARSPLYALARERLGAAAACTVRKDGDSETLSLSFAHGGAMTVMSSPSIEVALQRLSLGQPAQAVTRDDAVAVLRKAEIEAAGSSGCGIREADWRAAASGTDSEVTLSGDACNCKAMLRTEGGAVTALGFSTAC